MVLKNQNGKPSKDLEHVSSVACRRSQVYGKETSERIYELAKLYSLGYEVFDSEENFKQWLISPSKSLGGREPFELLDSSFGFQVVQNEIVRIHV